MSHHHKSNSMVEGSPDSGHGRGLPRRPDDRELERRADLDRAEVGLRVKAAERPRRATAVLGLDAGAGRT
jgi:hypothetical protein